ncbi:MSCRAMM family adhesin SdrC, partial [Myxococcota bacterium]|nr:MSCRAMM family adhesin SdrC [Myxococcota bacterium]
ASLDAATDASLDAATDASLDAATDASLDAATDAGRDAATDASLDASTDAGLDGSIDGSLDATTDASLDASTDAGLDAGADSGVDAGLPCVGVDCTFLDGECTAGICNPVTGACEAIAFPDGVPCDDQSLCTFQDACVSGVCTGAPDVAPGDQCATAIVLAEAVGAVVETGDTSCAVADTAGTCAGASSADVVYALTLTGWRRVSFEGVAASGTGTFDPALYFRDQCDAPATELVCSDSASGRVASLESVLAPGDYFLWVDGSSTGGAGEYGVTVDIDPQDTCRSPSILPLPPIGSTIEVRGTTVGANDDFQTSCAGNQRAADHVYELTIPATTTIRLETLPTGLRDYDTALHVRAACTAGNEPRPLACDDDSGAGTLSRLDVTLMPGVYYVVVDGWGTSRPGDYRLAITQLPGAEIVQFPQPMDGRLTQVGGAFATDGDFVEGIRTITSPSVTRATIEVDIAANSLTCDVHDAQVMINGIVVGTFQVMPMMTHVSQSYTFPAIAGPSYALRYETTRTVTPGCGSIDYSNTTSTVILSP